MQKILIFSGVSGSGKDTATHFFNDEDSRAFRIVKFSQRMKNLIQDAYHHPDLNRPHGKNMRPVHFDGTQDIRTAQELMVEYYDRLHEVAPYLMPSLGYRLGNAGLVSGKSLIFNDVRRPLEVKVIKQLAEEHDVPIHVYLITGRTNKEEYSDRYLRTLMGQFDNVNILDNSGELDDYYDKLDAIYQELYG